MGRLWDRSGAIERDNNDNRATGAKAYFFEGGTTTPLTVYTDALESTPATVPVVADGSARWPATFIPFITSYDVQVTTSGGTQLYYYQNIPNPDPVTAASGSVSTGSSQVFQTGDTKWRNTTGAVTGWVRMNGRTIGSAASGATERANADTADLYSFLWFGFTDSICPVSGGRGASAAADFAANKPLQLLDMRGRGPFGLDDMGASAAGRLGISASFQSGSSSLGGSSFGEGTNVLQPNHMASHTHPSTYDTALASFAGSGTTIQYVTNVGGSGTGWNTQGNSTNNQGHNNYPPGLTGTWHIKL